MVSADRIPVRPRGRFPSLAYAVLVAGLVALFVGTGPRAVLASTLDSERLKLELLMQNRVEEALSRLLTKGQFVVVIRIEPVPQKAEPRLLEDDVFSERYFLPGVPIRQRLDGTEETLDKLVSSLQPGSPELRRFIRRITALLLLDQALSLETVEQARDLTRQIVGLDPLRGDVLEIQRTTLVAPTVPERNDPVTRLQQVLRDYWLLIALWLLLFCAMLFFLFVFGPLRGFLNRFVQVLPTLKSADTARAGRWNEAPGMQAALQQYFGMMAASTPMGGGNFQGSLQLENPNKTTLPFSFIREDHVGNLAILLAKETPERAAVVLGYLSPEWISRILATMDSEMQKAIADQLATTKQLLPEQVEDIEQDLKRRLDYMVGGPERLFAIYDSLDAEAQRRMLENLYLTRPEMAEELRQRTIQFEDLDKLEGPSLKTVLREVDLQTLILSLKGMDEGFIAKILEHVSPGKAEIIREEMELDEGLFGRPNLAARKKVSAVARRLKKEGQIQLPVADREAPSSRYGDVLRRALRFPAADEGAGGGPEIVDTETVEDDREIEERIRRFVERGADGGMAENPSAPEE